MDIDAGMNHEPLSAADQRLEIQLSHLANRSSTLPPPTNAVVKAQVHVTFQGRGHKFQLSLTNTTVAGLFLEMQN